MSEIRFPDGCQSAINREKDNDVTIWQHDVIIKFFDVTVSSLITGPSFMSITYPVLELWQFSFIKDWANIRKSEIPPFEGLVSDIKFGTNVSNEMLLNTTKFQVYSFYHFWNIKGKPTGGKISSIHLKLLFWMYLKEMFLLSCRSWEVPRFKFERIFKNYLMINWRLVI